MNNITVGWLDESHLEKIIELRSQYNKVMRTAVDHTFTMPAISHKTKHIGAIRDGELICYMRIDNFESFPYYQVSTMYTKQAELGYYSFDDKNPILQCCDFMMVEQEKLKKYSFFYCRANTAAYKRLHKTGKNLMTVSKIGCRYDTFVQEIVPANTRSSYMIHDNLLNNMPWAVDTMILQCSLRQEFRHIGIL